MGGLPGLLGLGGGSGGTGFDASQNPLQPGQLQAAQAGVAGSLQSQQALLQAIQAQNGLENQSQVYNQLQGIASGAVNPAQAQFNQNTAANVGNQAALMAGQRGASSNVGLMARQAAQQGAGIQQQAVGQEAAQQAQNQISAIGAAGNLASTQAANQIATTQMGIQGNLANQGQVLGAQGQYNATQSGLANTQLQGQQKVVGGVLGGVGSMLGLSNGGTVPGYADGGGIGWTSSISPASGMQSFAPSTDTSLQSGTQSALSGLGRYFSKQNGSVQGMSGPGAPSDTPISDLNQSLGIQDAAAPMTADAGPVSGAAPMDALASSLGTAAPLAAAALSRGGNVGSALKLGGGVPGKQKISGNDKRNDTVSAKLSPGELVVDKETMQDGGPAGQMARLLSTIIESKKRGKK